MVIIPPFYRLGVGGPRTGGSQEVSVRFIQVMRSQSPRPTIAGALASLQPQRQSVAPRRIYGRVEMFTLWQGGYRQGFEGSLERRPGQNQKGRFLTASSILFYRTDHLP